MSGDKGELAQSFRTALALQQSGRLAEAESVWRDMLTALPDHDGINTNLATVLWRQGRLNEAADACQRATAANPNLAEAHALTGAIAQAQGRADDAVRAFEQALAINPGMVTVLVGLANLHNDAGAHEKARTACEQAEAIEPGRPDILNTWGVTLQTLGEDDAAEAAFRRALDGAQEGALAGEPRARIHTNLGALLERRGRHEEARASCQAAVDVLPGYAQAHNTLGAALKSLRRFDAAAAAFNSAIAADPGMAAAHSNLGTIHGLKRDWDRALACYEKAIELNSRSAEAHNNRGNVLHSIGRHEDAFAAFETSIGLDANFPDAHFNRGLLLLLEGRWAEGWPEFEWRWQTPQMEPFRRNFPMPQWDGAGRPTETLLLHMEQGMGDTLQFIRYVPLVAKRVGRIIVECQESLIPLLKDMPGIDEIIPRGAKPPAFDLHLPLMSLAGMFGTTIDNLPAQVPYLKTPADQTVRLPKGGGLKVGLVWAGNPRNPNDPSRSTQIDHLRPLLDVAGCTFFSLQHGTPGDQIAKAGLAERVHDLRPQLADFAATAALVDQLDMVITICTSVAHLAGGMGVETWVMLSKDADWRWLLDRDDSPWYPTARLFRQDRLDDWDGLAASVAEALVARRLEAG